MTGAGKFIVSCRGIPVDFKVTAADTSARCQPLAHDNLEDLTLRVLISLPLWTGTNLIRNQPRSFIPLPARPLERRTRVIPQ
jgi:hypothetical protein